MKQDELRQVREGLGLSQERLASLLKVSQRTVHNWESGKTEVPAQKAEEIKRLAVSINQQVDSGGIAAGRDVHHVNTSQELDKMLDALNESLKQNSRLIGIIEKMQEK